MRLKDEFHIQDDQIIHAKTYDPTQTIEKVKVLADQQKAGSEMWHVGSIPIELMSTWVKEAGLKWDDREAVQDMVRKKLLSGDYAMLRPNQGSF